MTDRTQQILDDLQGVRGQGFLLTVVLRDFAEGFERRVSEPSGIPGKLLEDMESDPNWLDTWGQALGMETQFMVYMVAARTLLKEYVAEYIRQKTRKQLGEQGNG